VLDQKHQKFVQDCLGSESYQANPIAGDASNRLYYRIIHDEQSYVLMVWEAFKNINDYPFLNILNHFAENHIQVPKVIGISPEQGLVLLEDLGDLTLERKFWEFQNQEHVLPHYKLAIDELIKINFHVKDKKCVAYNMAFDTEKLLWEMNYGKKHLLNGLCKTETSKELEDEFLSICNTLSEQPRYITHRDYHSRNLMIKLGKMRVIDFQDARLGPIQYDLVSLFHDSYVDLSEQSIQILTEDYLMKAKSHLDKNFSTEEFYEIFELQLIQRCFKACGSFSSFFNAREDRRYLKYLKNTIHKVHRTLQKNGNYPHFLKVIEDSGALTKNYNEL